MDYQDDWMPTFYVGQHESKRILRVTDDVLRQARDCNYDMLTVPITNDYFHSRVLTLLSNHLTNLEDDLSKFEDPEGDFQYPGPTIPALSLVDSYLSPGEIISQLLAVASPWIDLCSPDPVIYNISRQVLELEVAYAAFCGVENVIVSGPRLHHGNLHAHGLTQYARAIQEALNIGNHLQVHIQLPIIDHPDAVGDDEVDHLVRLARDEYVDKTEESRPRKADLFGTWDAWNVIRTVCKYNSRLFVDLLLPRHLPPPPIQSRWYSEPVRLLSMTAESFVRNQKGYPVLSSWHQALITRFMRTKMPPWILLCDVGPIPGLDNPSAVVPHADGFLSPSAAADAPPSPTPAEAANRPPLSSKKTKDPTPHLSYVRNLQRKQPPRSPVERYGSGYQDYLQTPLQPLTDNLESMTYEVFEKDPVKYDLYEKAIGKALRDWRDQNKPTSSGSERVVVAVAGAGRGPLVTRALRASETEGVEIDLWAVEKNPNAYVLLQRHNVDDWKSRVRVVQSDMRSWRGPLREGQGHGASHGASNLVSAPSAGPQTRHTRIDILISELLGSFADNELSPECLDGILHLLNPAHGISIPSSYTAYVTPIAAPKLHADISSRLSWDSTAAETPAVVWLHAIDYLSLDSPPPTPTTSNASTLHNKDKQPRPPPQTNNNNNNKTAPPAPQQNQDSFPNILPTWTFTHKPHAHPPPTPISNTHNTRRSRVRFRSRDRGVCHGLAGYFEAVLYKDVELSTNPLTMEDKSKGMISWFPIYFPLKTPLYIPDHAELEVHMWRQSDSRKVWYEWMVETYGWNVLIGGEKRRVRLGCSDLHSSCERGCLM